MTLRSLAEAQKLCEHFAAAPTQGLALIKRALNASAANTLDAQLDLERDLQRVAHADAGLRRRRARLHGKAQTEFHRPQMSQAKVRALRSVDLGFADPDKALRFFTEVWNLTPVGELAGVHYLRGTGAFHHIVTMRRAAKPALIRMVLDAADRATVDALHAQVIAHGLKTIDPPAKLRQPHGDYGFGFKDPEGRNIAVVCGVEDHADAADRPDRPRKRQHININAGDSDATLACYRDALGFTLTDTTRALALSVLQRRSPQHGARLHRRRDAQPYCLRNARSRIGDARRRPHAR